MDKGLETMTEPLAWSHKVRHSRGIASIKAGLQKEKGERDPLQEEYMTDSSVCNVINTRCDNNITHTDSESEQHYEDHVDTRAFFGYSWDIIAQPLEELVRQLEHQGYKAQWVSENIVNLTPPEGGSGGTELSAGAIGQVRCRRGYMAKGMK